MQLTTRRVLLVTATTDAIAQCMAAAVEITGYFREVLTAPSSGYTETTDAHEADFFLFVEPPSDKERSHLDVLRRHPLVRQFPHKCFAYDGEDMPAGFLPGAYPGISRPLLKNTAISYVACPYVLNVQDLEAEASEIEPTEPELLFQFMGYQSSSVRKKMFEWALPPGPWTIERTHGWFDHTPDQRRAFVRAILRAKFGLCPRGRGVASYRLLETMALGRPPVILSDEWVPFAGPEWDTFSIRVPERDYHALPRILAEREPEWRDMGRRARDAHQRWCTPRAAATYVLARITELQSRAAPAGKATATIPHYWDSRAFRWQNGWTRPQIVARKARAVWQSIAAGTFASVVRRKLANRYRWK